MGRRGIPIRYPAIVIVIGSNFVWPNDTGKPFGTIRDGIYVDSLRAAWSALTDEVTMRAGWSEGSSEPRPGTYDVTVAAPGYVTWDTTGVVVEADSNGVVRGKYLGVQLVELP